MNISTIKRLIFSVFILLGNQVHAQRTGTNHEALKFFDMINWYYITENSKSSDGRIKQTAYRCYDFSLDEGYLILLAKNIGSDKAGPSVNFLLDLRDSLILNADEYKKNNAPIVSMVYLTYRNFEIKYRLTDFSDDFYKKTKQDISIAAEYMQRIKEFQIAFNELKTSIDSIETAELKLSRFKRDFINAGSPDEISETQRKYIVQANASNDAKNYSNALMLYQKALDVNKFTYPDAYFNMALIHANVHQYYKAVFAMKQYLILSPESADARKAQDKIYEWELNIK